MILREIKNIYVPVLQQIEYLEVNSDHQQYIDTEIKCSSNMTFDLNIYIPQYTARAFWCFGGRDRKNVNSIHIAYQNNTDAQQKIWRYGNVECLQDGILVEGWHRFQNNSSGTLMIDNSINLVTGTSTFSTDINFYLLTLNVYNTPALANTAPGARIKQSKIYISNVLVRDFIPVRVGSVGYLYDRVSKRLFGNKGTGNFVLGQDVNSGLQQIYQNKLIGGVDYETADWLVQDENGGAYIDTKINDLTDFSKIKVHYYVTGNPSRIFGREAINSVGGGQCLILINSDNTKTVLYCPKGYMFKNVDKEQTMYIDFDNQQATLNNTTVSVTLDKIVTSQTMKVFTRYPSEAKAGVKFAGVTFTTTNGDILHLVPCQLLRSIPRNLDAQCKERVAGECGMIDLISGKFYGNVASSGTFTVENDNNE